MRIHSRVLTNQDIYAALRTAGPGVYAPILSTHGSRSHGNAFEVQLAGHSPYRSQGHGEHAATWDEWGVFFARLFEIDPSAMVGNRSWGYADAEDFHRRTHNRFRSLRTPSDTHPAHKWRGDGTGQGQYCTKCSARFSWK